jgi:O-antigen ligase
MFGVGYGSFWDIGQQSPIATYEGRWFSNEIQGHNGYLDIILTTGFIGLAVSVIAAFINPVLTIFRHSNWVLKCHGLSLSVIAFFSVHNLMESTLFRQAHPLWVLFLSTSLIIAGYNNLSSSGMLDKALLTRKA